jgi:hypothetical protein
LLFRELESVGDFLIHTTMMLPGVKPTLKKQSPVNTLKEQKLSWLHLTLQSSVNKSLDSSVLMRDLLQYGFARKRKYDTLTVDNIYMHPTEWEKAKSFYAE